jgi:hypothetical protein
MIRLARLMLRHRKKNMDHLQLLVTITNDRLCQKLRHPKRREN